MLANPSLVGCGRPRASDTHDAGGPTFVDEAGRRVRPRTTPTRRVVSLAPNVTELLFAIGADDQIVGVDNYSDQPIGLCDRIPKVGTDYEPSLERVVGLNPDIVFTSVSANRRETVEALQRLGVPAFVTDTRAILDMDRIFRHLGVLTGHSRQAEEQIGRMHAGFDAVGGRVAGRGKTPVLVVVWNDPLYVAGRGTFTHDLIELAGGVNVAADAVGFARYPLERVLHQAPEVIVLPTHSAVEEGPRAVASWSRWSDLPAVKNRRVHTVDDSIITRPGARLVQAAALLADLLHPEATTK